MAEMRTVYNWLGLMAKPCPVSSVFRTSLTNQSYQAPTDPSSKTVSPNKFLTLLQTHPKHVPRANVKLFRRKWVFIPRWISPLTKQTAFYNTLISRPWTKTKYSWMNVERLLTKRDSFQKPFRWEQSSKTWQPRQRSIAVHILTWPQMMQESGKMVKLCAWSMVHTE